MKKMRIAEDLVRIRKCHTCGNKFPMIVPANEYGYAIRKSEGLILVFCSYQCMRKYEAPILEKKHAETVKQFELSRMDEYLETGKMPLNVEIMA